MGDWEPTEEDFKKLEGENETIDFGDSGDDRIFYNNFAGKKILTFKEVMFQMNVWTQVVLFGNTRRHKKG